jgi:hypothetical protein
MTDTPDTAFRGALASLDAALRVAARAAVDERVAELSRPVLATQRTIERIVGMPQREFLRLARAGAFESWKVRRCVYARVADVIAFVERHPVRPRALATNVADDALDAALARVGARRVRPRD